MRKKSAFSVPAFISCKAIVLKMFFSLIILLANTMVNGQNKTVTGTVVDGTTNEGISEASVTVRGMSKGVVTDSRGVFTISVPGNSVLEISSVGYQPVEIKAGGPKIPQIKLIAVNKALTDVVVVGYGTEKRSDITGSVTSVPKQRLTDLPVTNVLQAIQGSVPGVNITQNSSVPGD